MTDETDRRLSDIEKRLARLERMQDKPEVQFANRGTWVTKDGARQFCLCGRDVCRAPDCPSHRKGGE